jgi:L-alanine-DL-glutamate epimerase-like enolase superfamily enzyme
VIEKRTFKEGDFLKIIGIEVFPLSVSFGQVIEESFGTVGKREDDVVIKIYTDEGVTGLGEGNTLGPFYSGESQGTVIDIIANHLFPKVLEGENPFNIELIHQKMDRVVYGNSVAKSAVDFALHDIMGKSLGVPVYQLLGGCSGGKIPLRWSVGIGPAEEVAELALQGIRAGFQGIKMKVGLNPSEDVKLVEAIRKSIGPDLIIDVDVNGGYRPKEAIDTIKKMEEFGPLLIEQPVRRDDLESMAMVKRNVNVPIGACESALTLPQIMRVIKMEAADFFNYKIDRSGGFFRGKQAVHMIDAAGLFSVGSEQLGFGIIVAAQAHFAVSTPILKRPAGYGVGLLKIAKRFDTKDMIGDIVINTPKIVNGHLEIPQGPGLGVELDEDAVKKYLTPGKSSLLVGRKS